MKMKLKFDKPLVVSILFCFIPILFSLSLYKNLPDRIPIHFDLNGNADNYSNKFFSTIGIPIICMIITFIVHLIINSDPKKQNHSKVLVIVGKFTIPILCLIFVPTTILISLGYYIPIPSLVIILISILFIIIGNYLPKCRQNYTTGIKTPWTLNSPENWKKTHRLAGFTWIIGGIITLSSIFLNPSLTSIIFFIVLICIIIIPITYSFILYKKQATKN